MANSTIFPIFIRSEYKDSTALKRFESDAQRAAQSAKRELAGVSAALEQALSRPRNAAGSLDLGVDEMRRALMAQQQVAAAAREVATATKAAAVANGGLSGSMGAATRAAFELASVEERRSRELLQQVSALDAVQRELSQVASATDLVTTANRRGQAATRGAVVSAGQQRAGLQQLSFQLNDVATMFALGARPQQIFASQAGQVIQAVQMMTGGTSRLAAFLGGPWGLALTSAAIVVTPFIGKLFEAEKAADAAKVGANSLATAQGVLGDVFDLASGKIANQNELLLLNARLTALNLRSEALAKGASSRAVFASAGTRSGADRIFGGGVSDSAAVRVGISPSQSRGQNNAGTIRALLEGVKAGRITADEALKRSDRLDFTGTGATKEEFQQAIIDQAFSKDAERVAALINESLDSGSLSPELRRDKPGRTRSSRSTASAANKAAREAERGKATIQDALVRPFTELREESERRLQIEELLAQGREVEAAALSEVLRLERQIGAVSEDQRREVEQIVRAEAERTRELRVQQRLFLAQLDVLGQVERDLTDLLSGRSTDFFGNFRQALQDLQGQRLFEAIFGDAFRAIEDELRKSTPQGRANARYAEQVERTATTTARVEQALASLAESAEAASARLRGGVAANDNGGFSPRMAIAQAALQAAGIGTGITVNGRRPVQIARNSIDDLAKRIATGIGTSIGAQLEDVLGPQFAALLGDVIGGAIAGKTLGGTTGGILGGLEGLTGNIKGLEGLSAALGKAGGGAAVGTQVAGLSKLLGIKGSTTGAQIGGAIGSFIPIPGGNIIGAIAGNLLGGLLKGTPRGSATIGGVGGGLGVTGISGNRGSLKDASGNLAGSVLEAVNRIAAQLGAEVNAGAGRVSIGQRKDNLRVDPSGRGATKIGNGAIDFGQDAEAAIAFAVRDLIQDGVITGLRASEQRLLRAGSDIEAAMRDVLTFRSVFDRLREIKDPIGFAVEQVTREFDQFRDVFARAGADAAELASLEELAGLERARAIEDATSRVVGSLRGLLDNLRTGDSGLSIRTRRGNAVSEFDTLAARVAAGDSSAFDRFAEVSQQLLDIERQLFGSTQSYFDRLAQVTSLTEQAIAGQSNVTSIAAAAVAPVDDRTAVVRSIDVQTDAIAGRLDVLNSNFVALANRLERVGGGGGGGFGSDALTSILRVANF